MLSRSRQIYFLFCKFRYFKDLATEIKYTLPKINQELGYQQHDKCWLLGYRLKPKLQVPENSSNLNQSSNAQQPASPQIGHVEKSLDLEYDPFGREELAFGDIQKFADKHDMDVCIADETNKQVSLAKLRETVYRKYYQEKLFKHNSTSKKYKQIRVPENIQEHDILTKAANIKSLIKKGEFKFKIYSENDSTKSEKAIKMLCNCLGRAPSVKIEEHQLQEKGKGKPRVVVQRWITFLDFSNESKINYEQINKKWKRHLINKKLMQQGKTKKSEFNMEGLQNQSIELQKQIINELRSLKVPLPSYYKQYEHLEDMLQMSGKEHFMKFQQKQIKKINEETSKLHKMKKVEKQQNIQRAKIHHSKLQEQIKNMEISEEQLKEMRKTMRLRTVQDILEEIEQIKGDKVELDYYEVYKLKALQIQLKDTLSLAGYKPRI